MPHHDRVLRRGLGRTLFTAFAGLHLAVGAVAINGCAADGDRDRGDTADRAAHPTALDPAAHDPAALHDRLFTELDADGDGALTADELAGGTGLSAPLRDHLAALDADHDGALDRAELDQAAVRLHGPDAPVGLRQELHAHHREMFARADRDHDRRLSLAELQAAPLPGPMLAEHLGEIDADGDGALTHDEIAAAMARHHDHAPDPAADPGPAPGQ